MGSPLLTSVSPAAAHGVADGDQDSWMTGCHHAGTVLDIDGGHALT